MKAPSTPWPWLSYCHKNHVMTPEEYEAQRRSWAYGNVAIDNPTVTRADVDDAAEAAYKRMDRKPNPRAGDYSPTCGGLAMISESESTPSGIPYDPPVYERSMDGYTLFKDDVYRVQIRDGLLNFLDLWYRISARESREVLCALFGGYDENCTTAFIHEAMCFEFGEVNSANVERDAAKLNIASKGILGESGGEMFFLGEWHSHPGQLNTPSKLDIETATETCRESKLQEMMMLISGVDGMDLRIVTRTGVVRELEEVY